MGLLGFAIDIGDINRRLGLGGVTFLKSKMADASGQKKKRGKIFYLTFALLFERAAKVPSSFQVF